MADERAPSPAHPSPRRFGQFPGLEVAVGFDGPLPDSELQTWEGELPTTGADRHTHADNDDLK